MRHIKGLLLNDSHIGAVRSAGTTLTSRMEIMNYLLTAFAQILWEHTDRDVVINGDLFDGYEVEAGQVLALYLIVHEWLTANPDREAHIGMGNHDIAKNSQRTSSFALFCKLLQTSFPNRVKVYNEGLEQMCAGLWIIPHCVNQDLFDIELEKALAVEKPGHLLLHANYDNNFAVEKDHSLNVSEEWARKLVSVGWTLVFAHEHQGRDLMAGFVRITGNQWPTSVADCLAHGDAQKDGKKFAHLIDIEDDSDSGTAKVTLTKYQTWDAADDYVAMKWDELRPTDARFIRIEGIADSGQSADVISAIAKYRQQSKAFVITNAVRIAGIEGIGDMVELSVDRLQSINVLDALCDELTDLEAAKVRELLGEQAVRKVSTEQALLEKITGAEPAFADGLF